MVSIRSHVYAYDHDVFPLRTSSNDGAGTDGM